MTSMCEHCPRPHWLLYQSSLFLSVWLTSRNSSNHHKWLHARDDFVGQLCLRRFKRQIFFAREEADEWTALQRTVIANRPAQDRKFIFKRIEHRTNRDRRRDFKLH